MCWIGLLKLETAKEDIPITKVVRPSFDKNVYYPYYKTPTGVYEKGVKRYSKILSMESSVPPYCKVDVALHSYLPSKVFFREGFTSILFYSKDSNLPIQRYDADEAKIVHGIIPKGASYCINEYGEVVSNELILY